MTNKTQKHIVTSLRNAGLRITKTRLAIIQALSNTPLSITELKGKVKTDAHQATVYRAVNELATMGIVRRLESPSGTRYEYQTRHHHHITCLSCGRTEEVQTCVPASVKQSVLRSTTHFSSINGHTLEFTGTCTPCVSRT